MRRQFLLVAVAVAALAGCRNARKAEAPVEHDLSGTTFPHHEPHRDAGCTTCHEGAAKWTRLGEYRQPEASVCEQCHERKTAEDQKKFTPPAQRARVAPYDIRFSHADHLPKLEAQGKKGDAACMHCHQVLPQPGEKRDVTPAMSTCQSCHHHEVEVREARCTPCHVSLKRYPAQPIEQFTEFSHAGNFIREHGRLAKNSAETCAQCHDQTYCSTCHSTATLAIRPEIRFPENVTSDFIHRGDYASRHQFDVQRSPESCRKCHGQAFCESCHAAQNVSPRLANPRNPHPRDWLRRGAAEFHGEAARNNIVNCAGCHDQGAASNCVACHSPGGPGGNPHPAGFMKKHDREDQRENAACRACHRG